MEKTSGAKFLKASLIYFVIGVTMGAIITIGLIYDFILLSKLFERAHAHINLIGWVFDNSAIARCSTCGEYTPENLVEKKDDGVYCKACGGNRYYKTL